MLNPFAWCARRRIAVVRTNQERRFVVVKQDDAVVAIRLRARDYPAAQERALRDAIVTEAASLQ